MVSDPSCACPETTCCSRENAICAEITAQLRLRAFSTHRGASATAPKSLTFLPLAVLPFPACASAPVEAPPPGAEPPCRRAYDHRIRDLVCAERSPALFAQLGIPRSTTASWIRRGSRPVVTTELFGQDEQQLRARVLKLERRVQLLLAVTRLLFVMVRLFGFRLNSQRVPSADAKSCELAAIERAKKRIPLAVALRVLGLSASRYHTWRRLEQACTLEDRSSCLSLPETRPRRNHCRFSGGAVSSAAPC